MSKRQSRFSAYRTRFALVIVGLALGFAARWIGDLAFSKADEPHFKPMPVEVGAPEKTDRDSEAGA